MGKKKAVNRDKGKVRFEVRFDADVTEKLRKLADETEVSMNQLLHGLARWAVTQESFKGDPVRRDDGFVKCQEDPQLGAVWWGRPGKTRPMTSEELKHHRRDMIEQHGTDEMVDDAIHSGNYPSVVESLGEVYGHLDFTERRVVREDR